MNGPSDLPVNGRTVRSSGEWTNRLIYSGRKSQSMMTFRPACCTLAIDSRGRREKRQRINEKDREARVKKTPGEREARLARRRQRPVILSGTYKHTKPLCSPGMNQLMIPLFTSLRLNCNLVQQTVQTSYMSSVDFAVGENTESTSSIHNDDPSKVNNWFRDEKQHVSF